MCSKFTDADVGKRVETAAGESIGVVTMTGDETAYVELEGGVTDSVKAVFDWNADTDNVIPIGGAVVREVTADVVRLEGKNAQTTDADTDPVFDREDAADQDEESDRGTADEGSGETGDDEADETPATGEGRSGKAMEPETDEMTESGAERHPESEDQPPEGDRTVTKDRGEEEDR